MKTAVCAHPCRGKRHHDNEQEDCNLYPEETAVSPFDMVKLLMMTDPEDGEQYECQDIAVKFVNFFQE